MFTAMAPRRGRPPSVVEKVQKTYLLPKDVVDRFDKYCAASDSSPALIKNDIVARALVQYMDRNPKGSTQRRRDAK